MLVRSRRTAALLGVIVLTIGACSAGATTPPSVAPSVAPSEAGASPSEAAASPSEAASAAPSAVATVPDGELIFAGKLVICSDLPYPPQEYFDDQGNPIGSDIEIGQELARRLGLEAQIENSVFDTIIAAVTGGKCDIVISAQNITADRLEQVDMIPYFQAGQSFVVAKGNPEAINTVDDLCGKAIGAETGTTEVDYLLGTGDYEGKGLSQACVDGGKAAIDSKQFEKDSDALLALQGGQVAAYFADSPVAGFYTVEHGDQFELSGIAPLDPAAEGISVPKDKKGLHDAVVAALKSMIDDGAYGTILSNYGLGTGAVTAADVK